MGNRERQIERNNRLKQRIKPDGRLLKACQALRYTVEHPNEDSEIIIAKGLFRKKDPTEMLTITCDGVVVGYQVKPSSPLEINPYFDRCVLVRTPGYKLQELKKEEFQHILITVLEAFIEHQQGEVKMDFISPEAMKIEQRFMVAFPVKYQDATIQVPKEFNA